MLIDLPEEDYRRHNLEGKGKLPLCVRVEVLASVSHPVGNKPKPIICWVQPVKRPRACGGLISARYSCYQSHAIILLTGTIIDSSPIARPAMKRPAMSMRLLIAPAWIAHPTAAIAAPTWMVRFLPKRSARVPARIAPKNAPPANTDTIAPRICGQYDPQRMTCGVRWLLEEIVKVSDVFANHCANDARVI